MKRASSLLGPARGGVAGLALRAGRVLAWVDTRPTWDDTGVSALLVALLAGLAAAVGVPAWLAGLGAAGPLVVAGLLAGNPPALIALVPAALGAVVGALVHRAIRLARHPAA